MRCRFFLIGWPHAPVVEVAVSNVHDLALLMATVRFVPGEVVEIDDGVDDRSVLIPVNRVQFVAAA